MNQDISSIKKQKNAFFNLYNQKTSNINSKFNDNDDFSEDVFEIYNISEGQRINTLETRPDFLTFSAKTHNCL